MEERNNDSDKTGEPASVGTRQLAPIQPDSEHLHPLAGLSGTARGEAMSVARRILTPRARTIGIAAPTLALLTFFVADNLAGVWYIVAMISVAVVMMAGLIRAITATSLASFEDPRRWLRVAARVTTAEAAIWSLGGGTIIHFATEPTAWLLVVTTSSAAAIFTALAFPISRRLCYAIVALVWAGPIVGLLTNPVGFPPGFSLAMLVIAILMIYSARLGHSEFWSRLVAQVRLRRGVEQMDRVTRELHAKTRQAAEATSAKARFVASTSHELRTPLHGILGNAELLMTSGLNQRHRRLVGSIYESGKSLLKLVDDILDLSRAESGALLVNISSVAIRDIVDNVGVVLEHLASAKGLGMEAFVDDDVPDYLMLDGERIKQVLINLGGNAVKFTERGFIRLHVQFDTTDKLVRAYVTDTGPGIPKGREESIFGDFVRLKDRGTDGSGLGLAICRRLIKAMNGDIGVESVEDVGSTFWFWVPTRIATASSIGVKRSASGRITRSEADPMRRRVLVVDDNSVNRGLAVEQLEFLGYEPTAAEGGLEAISLLQAGEFDLILLDCQMPDVDGYQTAMRVRKMTGPNRLVPIVGISASVSEGQRTDALMAGMDECISKPLRLRGLRKMLQTWLNADTSGGAARLAAAAEAGSGSPPTVADELDENRVAELLELSEALGADAVAPVFDEFDRDIECRFEALLDAADQQDPKSYAEAAHAIKGMVLALGLRRVADTVSAMELEALKGRLPAVDTQGLLLDTRRAKSHMAERVGVGRLQSR